MSRLGLVIIALVVGWALADAGDATAANPIKLFAPWEPGFKWDTSRGFYFNPPGHEGIDFNGVYDITCGDVSCSQDDR